MTDTDLCMATCTANECVFNLNVNLTAGQLGYYVFDECPDKTSPTLGMEIGKTYKFVQSKTQNFFHPLGFAYFPDGAHDEVDELEPGIVPPGSGSACDTTLSCPAPMYFLNDEYLGTYSNDASVVSPVTTGEEDFGLDAYEPLFFYPLTQWVELGSFHVSLLFNTTDFTSDIFYFCHIHQFMSGRIKLMKSDGSLVQPTQELPELPADYYDTPGEFDQTCGSLGLEPFQLPNPECPDRFVCGVPMEDESLSSFASCVDAMNCHMFAGMTTGVSAESEIALFLHQMIPHHENAINMAKALLASNEIDCADPLEETPECLMYDVALSIVNGQNAQIQTMRALLDSMGYPETDDCTVTVAES